MSEDTTLRPGRRDDVAPAPSFSLHDLGPAELVWLADLREHLTAAGAPPLDATALSQTFDHYRGHWSSLAAPERWDPSYLVTAFGVALGDLVVTRSRRARWLRTAPPHQATTLVVRLEDRRLTVFPINAVARRWRADERTWISRWLDRVTPG